MSVDAETEHVANMQRCGLRILNFVAARPGVQSLERQVSEFPSMPGKSAKSWDVCFWSDWMGTANAQS